MSLAYVINVRTRDGEAKMETRSQAWSHSVRSLCAEFANMDLPQDPVAHPRGSLLLGSQETEGHYEIEVLIAATGGIQPSARAYDILSNDLRRAT